MILNEDLLRQLLVREMLWPTGTERREHTDEERRLAERRVDTVMARYQKQVRDLAYRDIGTVFKEDRNRGR